MNPTTHPHRKPMVFPHFVRVDLLRLSDWSFPGSYRVLVAFCYSDCIFVALDLFRYLLIFLLIRPLEGVTYQAYYGPEAQPPLGA